MMAPDITLRLDHADRILATPDSGGLWPRGAVWLTRIALENSVRAAWKRRYPTSWVHGMDNQLLAMSRIVDDDTLRRVTMLWTVLSRAGHHHHYELTPTAAEIRGWLVETRKLIHRLDAIQPTP
jgi:hypothetical protein